MRRIVFLLSASCALAALCMLAIGGFLTMDPPYISPQTADVLRTRAIFAFLVSALIALLADRHNWIGKLCKRR